MYACIYAYTRVTCVHHKPSKDNCIRTYVRTYAHILACSTAAISLAADIISASNVSHKPKPKKRARLFHEIINTTIYRMSCTMGHPVSYTHLTLPTIYSV